MTGRADCISSRPDSCPVKDRVWAVIPLRGGPSGKSRLAGHFDSTARAQIVAELAHRVCASVLAEPRLARILVVTGNPDWVAEAVPEHALVDVVAQPTARPGLNAATTFGREQAIEAGAGRVLVIHADLPDVTAGDISELLDAPTDIVLAPDLAGNGTNAIVVGSHLDDFAFQFGVNSYHAHQRVAAELNAGVTVIRRNGLGRDLDTPDDWSQLEPQARRRLRSGLPTIASDPDARHG